MDLSNNPIKRNLKRSAGLGLLLVIVAALTLEATSIIQHYFTQKGIREEANSRAERQMGIPIKSTCALTTNDATIKNSKNNTFFMFQRF